MGCIYMALCKENGKVYIGKTKRTMKVRKRQHLSSLRRPICLFHKALAKYGKDAFEWSELYSSSDEAELYQKEKEFVHQYNSILPNGYNMTSGGDGNYNVTFSEDWRRKNQLRADALAKEVYCLEQDRVYKSMAEASEKCQLPPKTITGRCSRDSRRSLGLHFCYNTIEDVRDLKYKAENGLLRLRKSEEACRKMSERMKGVKRSPASIEKQRQTMLANPPHLGKKMSPETLAKMKMNRKGKCVGSSNGSARSIVNITTGEKFATMNDAVRRYGLQAKASSNISSCCRCKLKTAYGFRWKYAEDIENVDIPQGEKHVSELDQR